MTSQPLIVCHHTHPFNDITPFVCRTSPLTICILSYRIYKAPGPHFMTSHHIIYDMTPTISEMASTVSVSSQWLYWSSQTNCMYDITPTLPMPSYALYSTSHPPFMTSHHCSYHITTTVYMTSHTLYMTSHTWQYKLYLCHLTHCI